MTLFVHCTWMRDWTLHCRASCNFGKPATFPCRARRHDEVRRQQRADNSNSVTLTTLHRAKGREWDHVFLLNCHDRDLPLAGPGNAAPEPEASEGTDDVEAEAGVEEERRLLYVGMTRARDTLALWAPQNFHVTQQRALGGRHVTALRSRFVDEAVLATMDLGSGPADFRLTAFREAMQHLASGETGRAAAVLTALSDPTVAPIEKAPGKGAVGAWPGKS